MSRRPARANEMLLMAAAVAMLAMATPAPATAGPPPPAAATTPRQSGGATATPRQTDHGMTPAAAGAATLDFGSWRQVVVQDGGRRKPVDTFARELLLRIGGRTTVTADGERVGPDEFVLAVAAGTRDWTRVPTILIGYRPLVVALGFEATRKRFAFTELAGHEGFARLLAEAARHRAAGDDLDRVHREAENVGQRLNLFGALLTGDSLLLFPPPTGSGDTWLSPAAAPNAYPAGAADRALAAYADLLAAYRDRAPAALAAAATALRDESRALAPAVYPSPRAVAVELWHNRLDAFGRAAWGYATALVLLVAARTLGPRWRALGAAGVVAAVAAVALQTLGLTLRCLISGRAPVTNMFESVIWVALGAAVLGLLFYARSRQPLWLFAALPISLACLLLVARLPVAMPAAIDPVAPVLRSNFWLTTHVLTITLSYAAFALAMALGHAIVWQYWRHPETAAAAAEELHRWLRSALHLGVLLLAVGTILGGVWANYSWGRFWGWDPKETWALIALLCYLFLLHGRLAGWWDRFGLAVGAIAAFAAILMTWYGVNFILGAGLHSYGFGVGGERYVAAFVLAETLFVGVAAWRRARNLPPATR